MADTIFYKEKSKKTFHVFSQKEYMADNILQQRKEQKNTPCFPIKKMADSILQQRKTLYVFPKRKWPTIFCNKEQKKNTSCFLKKKMAGNILQQRKEQTKKKMADYSAKSKSSREITTFLFSLLNY